MVFFNICNVYFSIISSLTFIYMYFQISKKTVQNNFGRRKSSKLRRKFVSALYKILKLSKQLVLFQVLASSHGCPVQFFFLIECYYSLAYSWGKLCTQIFVVWPWLETIAFTSSAINPFTYSFKNQEFRKAFRHTFRWLP